MRSSPWPWAIGGVMVAVLAGVVAFSVHSIRGGVDLVAPDYYARELKHQALMDATRRALELGTNAVVEWKADTFRVAVTSAAGATGTVTFYRPSDASMDQSVPFVLDDEGRYATNVPLASGLWRVRAAWLSAGQDYFVEKSVVAP